MPDPITALAATSIGGSIFSSNAQSSAASDAASAQVQSTQMQIDAQKEALAEARDLLSPFVGAGEQTLQQQLNALGLGGDESQQQYIDSVENSPLFQEQIKQGEQAMLQNASATGGLRGGNLQGALAQFRPVMLQNELNNRYSQLGGITNLGQASAAGTANAGMGAASNISNALSQQGNALAGAALGSGQAQANMYSGIGSAIGQGLTLNQLGLFGGGTSYGTTSGILSDSGWLF